MNFKHSDSGTAQFNKKIFFSSKEMDNEAFEVSEDAAVLSEGAGRKVIPFTRFLSTKSEGDVGDKFKIQKKVGNILLHRNEYVIKPVYFMV